VTRYEWAQKVLEATNELGFNEHLDIGVAVLGLLRNALDDEEFSRLERWVATKPWAPESLA
jgi:hypothetical protein